MPIYVTVWGTESAQSKNKQTTNNIVCINENTVPGSWDIMVLTCNKGGWRDWQFVVQPQEQSPSRSPASGLCICSFRNSGFSILHQMLEEWLLLTKFARGWLITQNIPAYFSGELMPTKCPGHSLFGASDWGSLRELGLYLVHFWSHTHYFDPLVECCK